MQASVFLPHEGGMRVKRFLGRLSVILILAAGLFGVSAVSAFAATVTSVTAKPATLQASQGSNHTITFTTPTGVAEGQTITLTFQTGFVTTTITKNDVDIANNGVDLTTAADCAGTEKVSAVMASNILTFTICAGDGGAIAAGRIITIKIGTHATVSGTGTNRITNPSVAGTYYLTIGGTFGDAGSIALPIGGDDSVAVTARVNLDTAGGGGAASSGGGGKTTASPVLSGVTVSTITKNAATISWNVDKPTNATVEYGITTSYGTVVSDNSSTTTHTINLVGLTEATLYHFRAKSADVNGIGMSDDFTFSTLDQTPPIISGITVNAIGQDAATVNWTTNESATSTVNYGMAISYGLNASSSALAASHTVILTKLSPATLYHFRVRSSDASANETISADGTFTTEANPPPGNVSGLTVTAGNRQNTLHWTNPLDADLVSIRVLACTGGSPSSPTDTGHGCSVAMESLATSFTHASLANGTLYYYGVFAKDAIGQYASGALVSAKPVEPDVPPSAVSNLVIASGNAHNRLAWSNPSDADLVTVRVVSCPNAYPSSPTDISNGCTVVYESIIPSFSHEGLANGRAFYYGVYAMDAAGQFSLGMFVSGTPAVLNIPPGSVSGLIAKPGDRRISLSWRNPGDDDLAAIRVLSCAHAYPSAPGDISGCSVVFDELGTGFVQNGLQNGSSYYYGIYARDTASQYSVGAFASAMPSAILPFCGDNACNGTETPFSCPADCGPVLPVCGNKICEAGETTASCPADCGLIPSCGNGICDVDETNVQCPNDCPLIPSIPPTSVPPISKVMIQGITADDVRAFSKNGKIEITPHKGVLDFLIGTPVHVEVSTAQLITQPERVQLSFGAQSFNFVRRSADNPKTYAADISIPSIPGSYATTVSLLYTDGTSQTLPLVSQVEAYGLVFEMTEGQAHPVPQTIMTLLEGSAGSRAWDATPYGGENPQITGTSGTAAWFVPNGVYRIRAEKGGYRTEITRALTVENHLAKARIQLHLEQPFLPAIAETVQQVRENPTVQKAAESTVPVVAAVVVANTATLAVGFNLLSYIRYLTTAPILLFSRRKRRGYGVVYNAITKLPVDLAIIRLYRLDEANASAIGQLVASRVTDKGGRYFFLAQPGTYRLVAGKTGFHYPSRYLDGIKDDGLYLDVYHTEPIHVAGGSAAITANIPLDPLQQGETTPAKIVWQRRFRHVQSTIAVLGNIAAAVVLFLRPSTFTFVMALVQVGIYALIRRLASPKKPVNWGIVYDTRNGRPLADVIARVFEPKYNKLLETTITDSRGRFTFLLGPNEYYAVFEKNGFTPSTLSPIDYRKKTEPTELAAKIPLHPAQGESPPSFSPAQDTHVSSPPQISLEQKPMTT